MRRGVKDIRSSRILGGSLWSVSLSPCFLLLLFLFISSPLSAVRSKDGRVRRYIETHTRGEAAPRQPVIRTGNYRALIILAAFPDKSFSSADAREVWDTIANEPGYSQHGAAGSIADYFATQSGGLFTLTFDVVGPYTLSNDYTYYGKNAGGTEGNDAHPKEMITEACALADADVDFSLYDWDDDGNVEMVFVLYAGLGENDIPESKRSDPAYSGTVWPHKSNLYSKAITLDGVKISTYACSNELANDEQSLSGLGTFCHEFSHCLGLPDLYQSDGDYIFDEWDLMDGGCYANNGWTPVGYSAYEKYLCGWLTPEELTTSQLVSAMPCMASEDRAYIIRSDDDDREFYILENRQWQGFDAYLPGHGLFITHVTGHTTSWPDYPNTPSKHPINFIPADGLYINESIEALEKAGLSRYNADGRSNYLHGAAYPYGQNDSLTANSTPASTIGKGITAIREDAEGLISFQFMDSAPSAITATLTAAPRIVSVTDLSGRPATLPGTATPSAGATPAGTSSVGATPAGASPRLYIIRYSDGNARKVLR